VIRSVPSLTVREEPTRRVALATGVELNVACLGNPSAPPLILLHGFPESHRTWRHQMLALAINHYVIAPDQRGFGESSRPEGVSNYAPQLLMADVVALADALGVETFTLIGHDWGGALAWGAALRYPRRVRRLALLNAPHPQILQRTLIDDMGQRRASQFIRTFRGFAVDRDPDAGELEQFFWSLFVEHLKARVPAHERELYIRQWSRPGAMTAMTNWYRAADLVVPTMEETPERPEWIDAPFPMVSQPTLLLWGMRNAGLLPVLLEGLETLVADLQIVRMDAGHFLPWEAPQAVSRTLAAWLARTPVKPPLV